MSRRGEAALGSENGIYLSFFGLPGGRDHASSDQNQAG